MTDQEKNPFKVIGSGGDKTISGLRQEPAHDMVKTEDVHTYLCACTSSAHAGSGMVIHSFPGIWEPAIGTTIQVADPSRDVTVCRVKYAVAPTGSFDVLVYFDDAELAP